VYERRKGEERETKQKKREHDKISVRFTAQKKERQEKERGERGEREGIMYKYQHHDTSLF